ncbi:Clusterin [Liparis tanakae]|uniref:Clusterin n=1 Tax=Liparis tanakae TaxID=230148 RepID=A0A4Z2H473_9TELE|nr:Clusterin [Liparis tanakae]
MMMMMMRKKGSKSVAVVALLLASVNCLLPPSKEDLNQISLRGEKYLSKQIETAVNGVKEMKSVMETSSEDHQRVLDVLEKTKEQKEEAVLMAQEMEAKLEQEQEVCNQTTRALWEQCKPCLKNTCVKYYSRTCSSGSGLVGRQLEEVLNRTSPFSIWINGENTEVLQQEGRRQRQEFDSLQEQFTEMTDVVDNMFSESLKVANHVHFSPPVFFFPNFLGPSRSIRSLFHDPMHGFQDMFSPMMDMGRNLFSSMGAMADAHPDTAPGEDGSVNEDVVVTKPFGGVRMTCREIRRNSAGCLKFREECQKCKEIQHIGDITLTSLKCVGIGAVRLLRPCRRAVPLTYETTLQVNITNSEETTVSVQLFDSPPMSFGVHSDILWTDPKFSEVVAQEALDRYKEASM